MVDRVVRLRPERPGAGGRPVRPRLLHGRAATGRGAGDDRAAADRRRHAGAAGDRRPGRSPLSGGRRTPRRQSAEALEARAGRLDRGPDRRPGLERGRARGASSRRCGSPGSRPAPRADALAERAACRNARSAGGNGALTAAACRGRGGRIDPGDGRSRSQPEPRKPYHHGNLRQALVAATLTLIEERGPFGFTLAEAARAAGVSAAAPYRHFRGRDELIEEVARQGFAMFADRLERAWNDGRPSALSAFMATGRAYLDFARENPGYYIAMFESGVVDRRQRRARARRRPGDVGAGARRRAAGRASAGRPPAAGDDGREPRLGVQPRRRRALRPRPARRPRALFRRRDAGERHGRSTCAGSG